MTTPAGAVLHARLGRPIRILLVEDSASDRLMTVEALRDARVINEMYIAEDGEEATDFLFRRGKHPDAPRPDLVILDLNLPRKDGRRVLAEIKADPELNSIPVVILTTSSAEADILQSYQLQAAGYVTKPVGFGQFLEAVKGIESFWLAVVQLPIEPAMASHQ